MSKLLKILLSIYGFPLLLQAQSTTLTLQPGPSEGKDAYVGSSEQYTYIDSTNYGDIDFLKSEGGTTGVGDIFYRSFLQFDLSVIPKGAYVQSATLYLYANIYLGHLNSSNSNASWVERVTGKWYEDSITWINQPASDPVNRSEIHEESYQWADHAVDVTALYQDIVNQPDTNRHGVKIYLKNEEKYARLSYHSSDFTYYILKRPKLVITYTEAPPFCHHWLGDCDVTSTSYHPGKVAINTNEVPIGYIAAVNGKVVCEDVLIEYEESWPDYVFEEDRQLKDLYQLAEFIEQYKHLPGLPSQEEVNAAGFHLGKMSALQLEKIEELLLYAIEQRKIINELKERIAALESSSDDCAKDIRDSKSSDD